MNVSASNSTAPVQGPCHRSTKIQIITPQAAAALKKKNFHTFFFAKEEFPYRAASPGSSSSSLGRSRKRGADARPDPAGRSGNFSSPWRLGPCWPVASGFRKRAGTGVLAAGPRAPRDIPSPPHVGPRRQTAAGWEWDGESRGDKKERAGPPPSHSPCACCLLPLLR